MNELVQVSNAKRANKINLCILYFLCISVVIISISAKHSNIPFVIMQALAISIISSAIYFVRIIPTRYKALATISIIILVVSSGLLKNGFNISSHYLLLLSIIMSALYFDTWIIVRTGIVYDATVLSLLIFARDKFIPKNSELSVTIFLVIIANAAIILMYFLSKWGQESLQASIDKEKKTRDILESLENFTHMVAAGDINAVNIRNIEDERLQKTLNRIVDSIQGLEQEISSLTQAALEGQLDHRGDNTKFSGSYKNIILGINQTMDAMLSPIQESTTILKQMTEGILQNRVEGNYKGDHAVIKNALNEAITSFSAYIQETSRVLHEMADKNLMVSVSGEYKGDFHEIKSSLNLIIDTFQSIMREIYEVSQQVAFGARNVADGSGMLAQGASEQASAIDELSAAVNIIAQQTKSNASNANEAKLFADKAKNSAETGNQRMKEMLTAMEEINLSSTNIAKIIKVIDEIAFQTNILALNAAVEAARAGQYGRGFAVVAEEVRNLAAKSAEAAQETTDYIENSVKKVGEGMRIAGDTATSLHEIVSNVTNVADRVNGITIASNEQASGIIQINLGVEQVSAVTQNNASTAQQSAASSQQLMAQAEILRERIGEFKLEGMEMEKKTVPSLSIKTNENSKQSLENSKDFCKY